MLKRQTAPPKGPRKRKRGSTSYTIGSLDSPEDKGTTVENIRIWDISTSERTGRVSASRRSIKHYQEAPSELEEPPSSKENEEVGGASIEEAGNLADSESFPEAVQRRQTGKRAKANKKNDSVSEAYRSYLSAPLLNSFFRP